MGGEEEEEEEEVVLVPMEVPASLTAALMRE
jgi:hypothetical protein